MSVYQELIKNFEKIRDYMREFYIYGFKSREEYRKKSARSYDDERRRIESWLGEYIRFVRTPEGKNVFLSIDSRTSSHNPFYKALKTKSFTDGDITLHFILFDILSDPNIKLSLAEIMEKIDGHYLSSFDEPMVWDVSTVRKKLKEYVSLELILAEKTGKHTFYSRMPTDDITALADVLNFSSETMPCGAVGSFLLDKLPKHLSPFIFKHHYMNSAIDTEILAALFLAMREKRIVSVRNYTYHQKKYAAQHRLIPLRIFISVQSGRQHLIAYDAEKDMLRSFRVDYLSEVKPEEKSERFDELRQYLDSIQDKIWGVDCGEGWNAPVEHVEFTVIAEKNEDYIVNRLLREKRCGHIQKISETEYRFTADVYDTISLFPWMRTFICRIRDLSFSNQKAEKMFLSDLQRMYDLYGIKEEQHDFQ